MGGDDGVHYEFLGPHGTALLYVLLPATLYYLHFAVQPGHLALSDALTAFPFGDVPPGTVWFSWEALGGLLAWISLFAVLYRVVPGRVAEGAPLPGSGKRLKYPLNGLASMLVSLTVVLFLVSSGLVRATWPYDHMLELLTAAVLVSFAGSAALYARSLSRPADELAVDSGWPLYDAFMGRERNPRWLGVDLKYMLELRPGLIGWVVLNASAAAKEYELTGTVSTAQVLLNVAQAVYVVDSLVFEDAILSTMDITTDGLGIMLVFGDLAWVPFSYTLQARTIARGTDLSAAGLALATVLCAAGYYVFRRSNLVKHRFRTDPGHPLVRHLETMPTRRGTKLIVSGLWGLCQHPNYLGDLLFSVGMSAYCGFSSLFAWYYPIYFLVLLVHRQLRDDHHCRAKYGADWDKYTARVPYKIFPYIY